MDLAARDASRWINQADHGEPGDRFACAGFADHAQHFALGDVEGDAVDRTQAIAAGGEFHLKVTNGEDGFGHADRPSRVFFEVLVISAPEPSPESLTRM